METKKEIYRNIQRLTGRTRRNRETRAEIETDKEGYRNQRISKVELRVQY